METFISNYWPFLLPPAYVILFIISCWGLSAFEHTMTYRGRHKISTPNMVIAFIFAPLIASITILVTTIHIVGKYSGRLIYKTFHRILPELDD